MSQSKKGSCQGLWSAIEGDRTYTLKKGKSYHNLLYHEETHRSIWIDFQSNENIKESHIHIRKKCIIFHYGLMYTCTVQISGNLITVCAKMHFHSASNFFFKSAKVFSNGLQKFLNKCCDFIYPEVFMPGQLKVNKCLELECMKF